MNFNILEANHFSDEYLQYDKIASESHRPNLT
jgi:hypothetical protein